jgi:hypothetical protein
MVVLLLDPSRHLAETLVFDGRVADTLQLIAATATGPGADRHLASNQFTRV